MILFESEIVFDSLLLAHFSCASIILECFVLNASTCTLRSLRSLRITLKPVILCSLEKLSSNIHINLRLFKTPNAVPLVRHRTLLDSESLELGGPKIVFPIAITTLLYRGTSLQLCLWRLLNWMLATPLMVSVLQASCCLIPRLPYFYEFPFYTHLHEFILIEVTIIS